MGSEGALRLTDFSALRITFQREWRKRPVTGTSL